MDVAAMIVKLILRENGDGMPMGRAGSFLDKIGPGALYFCTADDWDSIGGFGALGELCHAGRRSEVAAALAEHPAAIPTLLKWIAWIPALDQRARDEHDKWHRTMEEELHVDAGYELYKSQCPERLITSADASMPISPRQSSEAHSLLMTNLIRVLQCSLDAEELRTRAVRSKFAMRCVDRLLQLADEAGRGVLPNMGASRALITLIQLHKGVALHAKAAVSASASSIAKLVSTTIAKIDHDNEGTAEMPPSIVPQTLHTLGQSALRLGIVRKHGYPGAFVDAERQIGCYFDANSRDAAIYDWLEEYILTPGRAVLLDGLSKSELNGKRAVVAGASRLGVDGARRMPVTVAGGVQKMAVKFCNLLCDPSAPGEYHEGEDEAGATEPTGPPKPGSEALVLSFEELAEEATATGLLTDATIDRLTDAIASGEHSERGVVEQWSPALHCLRGVSASEQTAAVEAMPRLLYPADMSVFGGGLSERRNRQLRLQDHTVTDAIIGAVLGQLASPQIKFKLRTLPALASSPPAPRPARREAYASVRGAC